MHPVQGGTQKLTMNSAERDYQQKLRQSKAQGDGNPYVAGVQSVMEEGAGTAISEDRTKYGNSNIMPNEIMQGRSSNFSYRDAPGNAPLEDPANQSGTMDARASATMDPQHDPENLETDALDRRMRMYAKAAGNAGMNLNGQRRGM